MWQFYLPSVVKEGKNKFFCALTYDERQEKTVQDQLHFGHSDWSYLKHKHTSQYSKHINLKKDCAAKEISPFQTLNKVKPNN